MLSKVLKKETCAECRFCCSFRRCSLWETPLFSKEVMDSLEKKGSPVVFKKQTVSGKEYGQMDLTGYIVRRIPRRKPPVNFWMRTRAVR